MSRRFHSEAARNVVREHVKHMREQAGLTGEELAHRIGRPHQSFIGKIEAGQAYLSLLDFRLICQACGVPPEAAMADLDEAITAAEAK